MERTEFYKKMIVLAEVTNCELSQSKLEIYYNFLGKYTDDEISTMFDKAMVGERFFPSLAALKSYLDPRNSPMDLFSTIENTPRHGISRSMAKEARKHMGEEAWRVIESFGGWQAYCDSNPQYSRAKIIKLCEMVSRNSFESDYDRIDHDSDQGLLE